MAAHYHGLQRLCALCRDFLYQPPDSEIHYGTENCTQKSICEMSFLPKQTVNSIITGFYKKGYIELRELPEDRRTKTVHLTELGKAYMETFSPHIENAEYEAMQALSEQQRTALLECIQLYGKVFQEKIFED